MKKLISVLLVLALLCGFAVAETAAERRAYMKAKAEEIAAWMYTGDFEAIGAEFGEYLASTATVQDVANLWNMFAPKLGAFVERRNVVCNVVKGYGMVVITDEFELDTLRLQINFDEEDKLFGMDMKLQNGAVVESDANAEFDEETTVRLTEESLALCDKLLSGEYTPIVERLNDEIRGGFDEEDILLFWQQQLEPVLGEYVQRGEVQTGADNGFFMVQIIEEFSKEKMIVQFIYDSREELMGFHFKANMA